MIEKTPTTNDFGLQSLLPAAEIDVLSASPLDVVVELDDGGVEVTLGGDEKSDPDLERLKSAPFDANLADFLSDQVLRAMATELIADVDADIESRKEWTEAYVKGMEVLGLTYEERTEPWQDACGVYSAVLTEAAVRFQSETIQEVFPAAGPVKTAIIGLVDQFKEEAAKRVAADMNYELTENMLEYRPEHERMLYSLGLVGSAFKKVYEDPTLGRGVSMFVPAEDLIMPYGASSIETSERVTHIMRKTKNEMRKLQAAGFYSECDLGDPVQSHSDIEEKKAEVQGYTINDDDRYQLYEVHVDWDIPGLEAEDDVALPYVVTIDCGTQTVLSVRRNWDENDKFKLKREHFVQYVYVPGFGVYGMGLIHLIGGYARAGTSIIRQLVDAGTLSNLPGGLKARGLRITGENKPIEPGEFRDVDVPMGTVRDNIMSLPYKEPSQVLMALLQMVTDEGRRLGSIADMKVSDMSANAPVGTTLAILERQLKTMSAVQARVHFSMRREFKLLKNIIRGIGAEEYAYTPIGGNPRTKQQDYDAVDVLPVSDPNSSTMAQRIAQYQAAFQMSAQAPEIYDRPQLHRQMLEVLGIANAEKIVPLDRDKKPADPISENMSVLRGEPLKAFIFQNHDAHLAVHNAFAQDPNIAKQMGQNPQAQQLMAALQAHIAEHIAFQYRRQIEVQLGVTLPPPDEPMSAEVETQLAGLVAQAAQQLLQVNKAQAAQEQAQQQAQDPLIQIQLQDLEVKRSEVQRKAAKDAQDAAIKQQELAVKQQDAQGDAAIKQQELEQQRQEGAQKLQQMAQEAQLKLMARQQDAQQRLMERRAAAEQSARERAMQQAQQAQAQQQATKTAKPAAKTTKKPKGAE